MSHLKQHAKTWEEYNELFVNGKKTYFNGKVKCKHDAHVHQYQLGRHPLHYLIADRQRHHQGVVLSQ
jgi:hypothetical protein